MKRKTLPIVLVSLLLGLVFDWLFYGKVPGVSVVIYTALILGFTFYLTRQFKSPINRSLYWLVPVILFFALMVFVRANPFLAVMNILMVIYLLMTVARLAQQPKISLRHYEIPQYISQVILTPLSILGEVFQVLKRLVADRNVKAPKSSYLPILRGVLLSLPILFVFMLLLSSADLVFNEFINSIFDLNVSDEAIGRLILIGLVTSIFTGAYAYVFMPTATPEAHPRVAKRKFNLGATESSIILVSVGALFLVFVIIQLAYLFGGSDQIVSGGYTYAEYARKGFFELIVVAAISLVLIGTIKKSTKFRTNSQALIFKWLSVVLMVEVMVIMLSAHQRLNLYEEAYGFTALRLLSHLFIVWLAVAFVLLLVHIIREKSENQFAFQLFVSVLCFFALINLINPDGFIARQNIDRFNKVGKLDTQYLSNLSGDAVPAVAGLLNHPNEKLQKAAAGILYQQKQSSEGQSEVWQSTNLARHRANQIFRDNATQIEAGASYDEYPELDTN